MRLGFVAFVVAGLLAAGTMASLATNAQNHAGTRSLDITLAGDAAAYLSIGPTTSNQHRCFVTQDATTGKMTLTFASALGCGGAGTGLNAASGGGGKFARYSFHDLLTLQNKGQKTVNVWVNETTTAGSATIRLAVKTATGQMADSDYASPSVNYTTGLASTSKLYLGLQINETQAAGVGAIAGTLQFDARAS
jgi:hypothetical protein